LGEQEKIHFQAGCSESGRDGITLDIHSTNIQTPTFMKAPKYLWGRSATEEGHEIDGFVKRPLDAEVLWALNPFEMNLTAEGTADHLLIDELTVMGKG
jgi:hypothetical protein